MKRIVLSNESMDRALGLPPDPVPVCALVGCIVPGPHTTHRNARGVRWSGPVALEISAEETAQRYDRIRNRPR